MITAQAALPLAPPSNRDRIIDIETTGTDPMACEIIDIASVSIGAEL